MTDAKHTAGRIEFTVKVTGSSCEANAARLALAWNLFDEMVEALEFANNLIDGECSAPHPDGDDKSGNAFNRGRYAIDAVLAKAKGQQS